MKNNSLILILVIISFSCRVSKGVENTKVAQAIDLQQTILEDELFIKILKELEQENGIDWGEERMKYVNSEALSNYKDNVNWLISKYKSQGVYAKDSVFLWRKWNPFSKTTAVTTKCINTTKLNKWRLKRGTYSLLNTLIHERVHSFCVVHPTQTRSGNECDPSYVFGDLAQIILLYRNGVKEQRMNKPFCPKLKTKVEEYGLLVIK